MFKEWEHHKVEDILTYRDQAHPSVLTGTHVAGASYALDGGAGRFAGSFPRQAVRRQRRLLAGEA